MDLERGRAQWITLIVLVCAFMVLTLVLRQHEQRGQEEQSDPDIEDEMQDIQEQSEYNAFVDIGIMVRTGTARQRIQLYQDEDHLYAFLPAGADTADIRWTYDEELYEIYNTSKGIKVKNGASLSMSEGDGGEESIRITDIYRGEENVYRMRLIQSENLPAVFINTQSGGMDWIHADKRNEESGELFCIDETGWEEYSGTMEKISGRGNSSWVEDKRSYSVTLPEEAALAGMPAARKWVLQANALDATRMRNKVTYDMALDLDLQYAIDSAYADVWLNGEYAGNYLICEKIEAGENRVNISGADVPQAEYGRYTRDSEGAWWEYEAEYENRDGYLLEFNERIEEDEAGYFYAAEQQVEIKSPVGATREEYQYINEYARSMVESLENAAQSDDYLNYIDLDSWSQLFLINELTNDTDANRYSVFYYKDKDTKMFAGPVWDYDIAWGNDFLGKDVRCSFARKGWQGTLYDNDIFYQSITEKYGECMKPVLERYVEGYIDTICGQIAASIAMDDIRWAHTGSYTRRSSERDWQQAVGVLKDYMRERMEFFDDVWLSGELYHRIFFCDGSTVVAVTYVKDGDTIPDTLLDYAAGCLGQNSWRTAKGETYDASQRVYADQNLYAQQIAD